MFGEHCEAVVCVRLVSLLFRTGDKPEASGITDFWYGDLVVDFLASFIPIPDAPLVKRKKRLECSRPFEGFFADFFVLGLPVELRVEDDVQEFGIGAWLDPVGGDGISLFL